MLIADPHAAIFSLLYRSTIHLLTHITIPSYPSPTTGGGGHSLSLMQDEWKSLLYTDHAVLNRDEAWGQVQSLQGFGSGGSKTNSLLWVNQKPMPCLIHTHPIDSSLCTSD